jgi:hypothetical protein
MQGVQVLKQNERLPLMVVKRRSKKQKFKKKEKKVGLSMSHQRKGIPKKCFFPKNWYVFVSSTLHELQLISFRAIFSGNPNSQGEM